MEKLAIQKKKAHSKKKNCSLTPSRNNTFSDTRRQALKPWRRKQITELTEIDKKFDLFHFSRVGLLQRRASRRQNSRAHASATTELSSTDLRAFSRSCLYCSGCRKMHKALTEFDKNNYRDKTTKPNRCIAAIRSSN